MVEPEKSKKKLNNNSTNSKPEAKTMKSPFGDKIIIDTVGGRSGTCVFHNFLYGLLFLFGALYFGYLCDKPTFQHYSAQYPYLGITDFKTLTFLLEFFLIRICIINDYSNQFLYLMLFQQNNFLQQYTRELILHVFF